MKLACGCMIGRRGARCWIRPNKSCWTAWYTKQDAEEAEQLKLEPIMLDLPMLQLQLQKALQQLQQLTAQIQLASLENDRLRAENLRLRLQLASQLQPA